jgi:hypothetical protein
MPDRSAGRIAALAGLPRSQNHRKEVQSSKFKVQTKEPNPNREIARLLLHMVHWFELWGLFELRILNFELPRYYVSCVLLAFPVHD